VIQATAFDPPFAASVTGGLRREAAAYGRYLGHPAELVIPG
jgi:hypothetical protein